MAMPTAYFQPMPRPPVPGTGTATGYGPYGSGSGGTYGTAYDAAYGTTYNTTASQAWQPISSPAWQKPVAIPTSAPAPAQDVFTPTTQSLPTPTVAAAEADRDFEKSDPMPAQAVTPDEEKLNVSDWRKDADWSSVPIPNAYDIEALFWYSKNPVDPKESVYERVRIADGWLLLPHLLPGRPAYLMGDDARVFRRFGDYSDFMPIDLDRPLQLAPSAEVFKAQQEYYQSHYPKPNLTLFDKEGQSPSALSLGLVPVRDEQEQSFPEQAASDAAWQPQAV